MKTHLCLNEESLLASPFDEKNIQSIVQTVLPLWRPQSGDEEFAKLYVEFLVRNNIFFPELSVQLTDENRTEGDRLLAAAFAERQSDKNDALAWLKENSRNVTELERKKLDMLVEYLRWMDSKTLKLMSEGDVKLSLFVSRYRGYGIRTLSLLYEKLCSMGFKNVYLWTDCECDWQWYVRHGYELLNRESYTPFCDKASGRDFLTFVFRKKLA